MDFNRPWTTFALEAEYEAHGMTRIAEAHNSSVENLEELRKAANKFYALELVGVDSWDGWDMAMKMYNRAEEKYK